MSEIQKQRDSEIVLLRLIGMLMIIGCHLCTYFRIGILLSENIPRTQNLEPLYTETCGLYVYPKELIMEQKNR